MATFTKIEDLFDKFPQSVGGLPTEGGNGNERISMSSSGASSQFFGYKLVE